MLADWITPEPITVHTYTGLDRCRSILEDGRIRHLLLVDGGWLVGVLDAATVQAAEDDLLAGDLAARRVPTVPMQSTLVEVLDLLQGSPTDVVVITDGGRPVGVFTEHDAMRLAARELPEEVGLEDWLTPVVTRVEAGARAVEARGLLEQALHRHLVVTLDGRLHGVLSWRDLEGVGDEVLVAECVRPLQWRLGDGDSLRDAARSMAEHHIGLLPVMADGQLRGVVSRLDVAAALRERLHR